MGLFIKHLGGFMSEQPTVGDVFKLLGQEYFNKTILMERVAILEKMLEEASKSKKTVVDPEVL
jgi:hypothetical protein